jgi:hypothetical protein
VAALQALRVRKRRRCMAAFYRGAAVPPVAAHPVHPGHAADKREIRPGLSRPDTGLTPA